MLNIRLALTAKRSYSQRGQTGIAGLTAKRSFSTVNYQKAEKGKPMSNDSRLLRSVRERQMVRAVEQVVAILAGSPNTDCERRLSCCRAER